MQEMQQGEDYEEFEDEELDYEDESAEDTSSDYIFGLPKKVVFIGVPILIIVVIALVLFALRRDNAKSDGTVKVGSITVYDSSGTEIGSADSLDAGGTVYDLSGGVLGTIAEDGDTPLYDKDSSLIAMYSYDGGGSDEFGIIEDDGSSDDFGIIEEDGTGSSDGDIVFEESSDFSDDEIKELRALGYTGDEIELAMSSGMDIESLKEDAQKLRDEEAKKALARMSDSASDEFKEIVNNSVYCLPYMEFENFDINASTFYNSLGSYVVNADYVKVPTYGHQLYIKCKIANGTYTFMCVEPGRWETLPEEGNIVLQINYVMYGSDLTKMYITSISEIDVTKTTVNPQDSAQDLETILSESNSGLSSSDNESSYYEGDDDSYEDEGIIE